MLRYSDCIEQLRRIVESQTDQTDKVSRILEMDIQYDDTTIGIIVDNFSGGAHALA